MDRHPTIDHINQMSVSDRRDRLAGRRDAAHESTARYGAFISIADGVPTEVPAGPLHSVPFVVKDNIDTADFPTTAGTPALRSSRPLTDAQVVRRLIDRGAVPVGKTNLHELAFGVTSNNAAFGPVRNPFSPDRSAGGSSGGSAVAVAVGVVPFALATDTGGSARIPAAHCDVVGFRPSTGRYSSQGVVTLSGTRDTVGVLASTVEDVAIVDQVLALRTDTHPTGQPARRLGVPTGGYTDDLEPHVARAFEATLRALRDAGFELVDVAVGELLALDAECGFPVVLHEAPRELDRYLRGLSQPGLPTSVDELAAGVASPDVAAVLSAVVDAPISEDDYARAQAVRVRMVDVHRAALRRAEVAGFLYPTVPFLAPPVGDDDTTTVQGSAVPVFATSIRNASPATLVGSPAISLPTVPAPSGLPIGVSVEAGPGEDRWLLAMSAEVEDVLTRLRSAQGALRADQ